MENMTYLFFSGYYSEKGFAIEWTVPVLTRCGRVVAQGFITAKVGSLTFVHL